MIAKPAVRLALKAALLGGLLQAASPTAACAPSSTLWQKDADFCFRMVRMRIDTYCRNVARMAGQGEVSHPTYRACRKSHGLPPSNVATTRTKPLSTAQALRNVADSLRHGTAEDQINALADALDTLD